MRRSLIIISICLVNYLAYSQWEIQNSGVRAALRDIEFVDSLNGWAVGDSATIIFTTDGGKTWERQIQPIDTVEFLCVKFLDSKIGFVGGNRITRLADRESRKVVFLSTIDGGVNWEEKDLGFNPEFRFADMDFRNANEGWIGINDIGALSWDNRKGVLLKTKNGGQAWSVVQEKVSILICAVKFWDDSIGYSFWSLYRDNFDDTDIYYSSNGGREWMQIGSIQEDLVHKAKCLSAMPIWAIGLKTSRSNDGGYTWDTWDWFNSVLPGEKRFAPVDIDAVGLEKIWLVGTAFSNSTDGEGTLMKTMNSGSTWEKQLQMLGSSFHCVNVTSSGMAWVAGGEGLILFTNDIIDNIVDNFEKSGELAEVGQNYPNPLSINYDKQTRIQFALKSSENICITVCDILGRVIKILMSQSMNSGIYEITWDGKNEEGIFVSSGVYFYVVRSKTFVIKKKMLVIH